jgi:hydroxymethylpyrimidine/phosphomethylpyrimidine kinase
VTAQDTTGVHGIHPLPAAVVLAQVEVVLDDLPVAAVKTGMLGEVEVVRLLTRLAAQGRLPNLVVDPVLVSTSGQRLTTAAATAQLRALLPHATLVTPNAQEAAALLGTRVATTLDEYADHAAALLALGSHGVVVTGAVDGDDRVDVLVTHTATRLLRGPAIETANDHGTGCTFASAAAASLARGAALGEAVAMAHAFVRTALEASAGWRLGRGRGPVSHLAPSPSSPTHPTTPRRSA